MALKQKRIAAGSTHFPNLEKKAPGDTESGAKVKNHFAASDLLVDPQDESDGGSTHTPIKAAKRPIHSDVDLDEDLDIDNLNEVDALYEDGDEEGEFAADTSSILDDAEDAAVDDVLEGDAEGDDAPLVDELEDESDIDVDLGEDDVEVGADADDPSIEEEEFSAEGIPLVDADGVEDEIESADDELAVASIGAALHVIRSNRIIASMTKKQAMAAGKAEVYQEDAFPSVVCAEVQKMGLRKGLTSMGFALATVQVQGGKAVKAAIAKQVTAARIQASADVKAKHAAFAQALAIASVGINRKFFKDAPNDLKAGLETELRAMGVRGATKIVSAMFAQHGIAYASTLVNLATKISAMPEETRDQFAEALDLTDDDLGDADEDTAELESDFDPDAEEELEVPSTVSAALARPLRSVETRASRTSGSGSVQEVLSGTKPLPWM